MIEYPKAFLEDLEAAIYVASLAHYNINLMPVLEVIHNFCNGKYGPINKNDMYARAGETICEHGKKPFECGSCYPREFQR